MKILFCSQTWLTKELGGSKPLLELAEEMRELGWQCDHICPYNFDTPAAEAPRAYAENLRRHLIQHASEYDVVDYDHLYLPYPRADFPAEVLLVTRSVLLQHHLQVIRIPKGRGLKASMGALIRKSARKRERDHAVSRAQMTIEQADLVNVTNYDDKQELMSRGISEDKIVVFPFGLSRTRIALFSAVSSAVPPCKTIAFVGTFDYRKGAREFPSIVERVVKALPDVRFRLLGTVGMFPTQEAILAHFPAYLHSHLDIRTHFDPNELPTLLSDCSMGVFPSYVEGFPFGVLEMLSASLPIVAYNSPGPPMMLKPEFLIPRGDAAAMSARIIDLLKDRDKLQEARIEAGQQSRQFTWQRIARETSETYLSRLRKKT